MVAGDIRSELGRSLLALCRRSLDRHSLEKRLNYPDCRNAELIEKREMIRYAESGLSSVALQNILVRQCPACDHKLVSIPNLADLHHSLAMLLVNKVERLAPEEISFLRKSLGWSKADCARKLHVRPEQVSRWESETAPT